MKEIKMKEVTVTVKVVTVMAVSRHRSQPLTCVAP